MGIDASKVAMYIEFRGVYDGWSAARMDDGTIVNRWSEDDPKYALTQAAIERMKQNEDQP